MQFEIAPSQHGTSWILLLLGFIVVALGLLIVILAFPNRKGSIQVLDQKILIKFAYSTRLNFSEVNIQEIEAINLIEKPLLIDQRINGFSFPGINVGWFKGDNQKYKLFLTEKSSVLKIPTTLGYTIYVSCDSTREISEKIINHSY